MAEINLDAERPEDVRPGSKARQEALGKKSPGVGKPAAPKAGEAAAQRTDSQLRGRLVDVFGRIADALEARGDEELSSAIREDGLAMAQGLVSLTGKVKALRSPLFFLLALVEPTLAFGRVFRILSGRILDRRARRQQEQEQQIPDNGQPPVV